MGTNRWIVPGCGFTACRRRFTGAAGGFYLACGLLLVTAMAISSSTASMAQTGAPAPAAESVGSLLPGVWRGVHSSGMTSVHHRFSVKRTGNGYTAEGIAWCAMSELQAEASLRGELDLSLFPNLHKNFAHPMCVQQQYAVSLQGDTVTIETTSRGRMILVLPIKYFNAASNTYTAPRGTMLARLEQGGTVSVLVRNARDRFEPADPAVRDTLLDLFKAYPPDHFTGRLAPPGIVARDTAGEKQPATFFRFWKEELLTASRPPTPEVGKTLSFACLDGGAFHYTCYLPQGYRPDTPMPVLMNFSPSGNAQPLSPNLAEKFGWIMVGLKESNNSAWDMVSPNRDAVLLDLQRRFRIDMKRLYFSGFSGGARGAALAAFDYPDRCAGALCIGASCIQSTPPRRVPIYFLVGETDINRNETTAVYEEEKRAGRTTALALHPGGHTWGTPEEQEAGLRWLANPKP